MESDRRSLRNAKPRALRHCRPWQVAGQDGDRSHRNVGKAKGIAMGFYGDRVLPRIIHVACGNKQVDPLRTRVCSGLSGDVVEIGFGSGTNIPFYPTAVTKVVAVEPSDLAWELADERLQHSAVPVERSGSDGQQLPFADDTFDAALSTWTLCTIPDAALVLREVRRVLRPGGTFHFVEHGLAPDEKVRRRQRRLEPVHRALLGGCHLTRPIVELVAGAGFDITAVETFYEEVRAEICGGHVAGIGTEEGQMMSGVREPGTRRVARR